MINCINTMMFFYEDINNLCKKGEYNLVLHKHLGDVFYAIGLKDEFERQYCRKLHFIVRPQHEFLMKLYAVTNYSVLDLKEFEKIAALSNFKYMPSASHASHKFDMMCKDIFSSTPIENIPFILDGDLSSFFLFDHYWCFIWANNVGINIENFKFPIPKNKLTIQSKIRKKIEKIASLDKIVLFAPEAATAIELPVEFWNIIADKIHAKGYKIIVNSKKFKINHGISALDLGLSLEDVVALGLNCAYVFSLRSGLCDVLVGAGERLYVFYPAMLKREMKSLTFPFDQETKVNEFLLEKWSVSPVVWENINLTPELQKYINSMKKNYHIEKIKYKLSRNKNKESHRFWYMLFKNIFNKSNIFPNNNIDNDCINISQSTRKKRFLGVPIYEMKTKENGEVVKHYIFGRLLRFKKNIRGCWSFSILGIEFFSYNEKNFKFFSLPILKFNWRKKWLSRLQRQIDSQYDDIYFLRHNIGETTVELMFLKERIIKNKSKKPLLIVWDEKNIGFYRMFVEGIIDIKYIKLSQFDIMSVFSQDSDYKEIVFKKNNQRFICSTPLIAENMALYKWANFYNYIKACTHIPKKAKPTFPVVSETTKENVLYIMKYLQLGKNFIILAPEANSLRKLPQKFWQEVIWELKKKGYDIFVNSFITKNSIEGVKTYPVTLDELFYLAQKAKRVITLGSGLSVLLALADVPMDIIYTELFAKGINYTATQTIEKYSVFYLPGVKKENITEYNTDVFDLDCIKNDIIKKC